MVCLVKYCLHRLNYYTKYTIYIMFWYLYIILFLSFKLYHRWNCCHTDNTDNRSTWFYISFIVHLVLTSNQWYKCSRRISSHTLQGAIIVFVVCCITITIWLRRYIVLLDLFYIISRCSHYPHFYLTRFGVHNYLPFFHLCISNIIFPC